MSDEIFQKNLVALSEYCQRRKNKHDTGRDKVVDVLSAIFNLTIQITPQCILQHQQTLTDLLVDTVCHDAFPIQKLSIRILSRVEGRSSNPKVLYAGVESLLTRAEKSTDKVSACLHAASCLLIECPALLGSLMPRILEIACKIVKTSMDKAIRVAAYDTIRRIFKLCPASNSLQFATPAIKALCKHQEKTIVGRTAVASTIKMVVSRSNPVSFTHFDIVCPVLLKLLQTHGKDKEPLEAGIDFSTPCESLQVQVLDALAITLAQIIDQNKTVQVPTTWQQALDPRKKAKPDVGPDSQSAILFIVSSISNKTLAALALMRFARARALQAQQKQQQKSDQAVEARLVEDVAMVIEAAGKLLPKAPTEVEEIYK